LKKNDTETIKVNYSIEELKDQDCYSLKFSICSNLLEKQVKRILSTLYIIFKDGEKIFYLGSCEVVIVNDKETAFNEIKECDKNVKYFQKSLTDKNLNILESKKFNNLIIWESSKKKEYQKYFEKNF
jgi:hypothetical protein